MLYLIDLRCCDFVSLPTITQNPLLARIPTSSEVILLGAYLLYRDQEHAVDQVVKRMAQH